MESNGREKVKPLITSAGQQLEPRAQSTHNPEPYMPLYWDHWVLQSDEGLLGTALSQLGTWCWNGSALSFG